ncbi:MAG: hypothetical protein ACO1TE_24570 [Prosthecobacter sp.]
MSPKQKIYRALLAGVLPYLRVMAGIPLWRRLLNPRLWQEQSAYHEAELVHNLHPSLFEPEFERHDLWFLNWQARHYCDNAHFRQLAAAVMCGDDEEKSNFEVGALV